jgi:rsbT co-antagonist protein RsbR
MASQEKLAGLLARHREKILKQWQRELSALTGRARLSAEDTRRQADEFFEAFMSALGSGASADINTEEWKPVRTFLEKLSKDRVLAGFSSDETAIFIFSLKRALFDALSGESRRSAARGLACRCAVSSPPCLAVMWE